MKYFFLIAMFSFSQVATPCSSFLMKSPVAKIFAKNYDWHLGHGYILTNKRNVSKKTLTLSSSEVPHSWTSKYGSTTFNQYGHEFPNSGVNEKGLAVEILWLDETVYPKADGRPSFNELQWIQYQLDDFASTKEVIKNADAIRISKVFANVHYLVCDRSGQCALFEYLKGNLVVTSGEELKPSLITNSNFQESSSQLKNYIGLGGTEEIPQGMASLERYVRAAAEMKCSEASVERAFDILELVRQGNHTKWQVVYDLTEESIELKTLSNPNIRTLKTTFDYSCKTPVLAHDLDDKARGDVTALFKPWTSEENSALVEKSLTTLGALGKALIKPVAGYPSTMICTE
jgi:penicillin V acylase-like amidase (Ntn superfamily)